MTGTSEKYVRQQVRNKITQILEDKFGTDLKVWENRVHPLMPDEFPCIIVKSGGQLVEIKTKGRSQPNVQGRAIETEIYVFVRNTNPQDGLDVYAADVEKAIFADPTLGGLAVETVLSDTNDAMSGEPNFPTGVMRMSFLSMVVTMEGKPEQTLSSRSSSGFQ